MLELVGGQGMQLKPELHGTAGKQELLTTTLLVGARMQTPLCGCRAKGNCGKGCGKGCLGPGGIESARGGRRESGPPSSAV
jgi:hypothetical protein